MTQTKKRIIQPDTGAPSIAKLLGDFQQILYGYAQRVNALAKPATGKIIRKRQPHERIKTKQNQQPWPGH